MQNPSTSLGAFEKRDVTPRNKHCPFGLGKKIHLENHGEKDLNKAVLGMFEMFSAVLTPSRGDTM